MEHMSDTSSVYKICPQCGQSVSVGAKFCPTCGTPFSGEGGEFVAYERYQQPEAQSNQYTGFAQDPVMQDGTRFPGTEEQAGTPYENGENGAETERDIYGFQRGRSNLAEEASNPGVRQNPLDTGKRNGLIVTVIAAVLLVAVIAVGVVMAFKLGIVGSNSDESPMTLAQQEYDAENYQEAIAQLKNVIASGEATVETYELLATTYQTIEEPEQAADAYLQGFQELKDSGLKKSAIEAYLKMGDTAKAESDLALAKSCYDTVLEKLDPSNSAAIAGLSSLSQQAEQETKVSPSPSTSPGTIAPPSPTATEDGVVMPELSDSPSAAPAASPVTSANQGNTVVKEQEQAVVTPTAKPSATPTPTVKPSPTPTPTPTPTPSATPTPTPSPSPSPTPTPETSFTLNGNTYKIITGDYTWWQAKEDAEAKGGHMLTVTSEEEFLKAAQLADAHGLVFMWLNMSVNSVEDWDVSSWGTGESMDYTAWYPGEPSGGEETYLSMFKVNGTWYFNDAANVVSEYSGKKGYILEIEG